MVVDADQSVVFRLPVIPNGPLLLEQAESILFEHLYQLAEPQDVFDLLSSLPPDVPPPIYPIPKCGAGRARSRDHPRPSPDASLSSNEPVAKSGQGCVAYRFLGARVLEKIEALYASEEEDGSSFKRQQQLA